MDKNDKKEKKLKKKKENCRCESMKHNSIAQNK